MFYDFFSDSISADTRRNLTSYVVTFCVIVLACLLNFFFFCFLSVLRCCSFFCTGHFYCCFPFFLYWPKHRVWMNRRTCLQFCSKSRTCHCVMRYFAQQSNFSSSRWSTTSFTRNNVVVPIMTLGLKCLVFFDLVCFHLVRAVFLLHCLLIIDKSVIVTLLPCCPVPACCSPAYTVFFRSNIC